MLKKPQNFNFFNENLNFFSVCFPLCFVPHPSGKPSLLSWPQVAPLLSWCQNCTLPLWPQAFYHHIGVYYRKGKLHFTLAGASTTLCSILNSLSSKHFGHWWQQQAALWQFLGFAVACAMEFQQGCYGGHERNTPSWKKYPQEDTVPPILISPRDKW